MTLIEGILNTIEIKKQVIEDKLKERYGKDLAKLKRQGVVQTHRSLYDPYWLTEHLNDEGFRMWYNHKQEQWWAYMKDQGLEEITCLACNQQIEKSQDMLRWAGIPYHGACFIGLVDGGERNINEHSSSYYERIKKAVFNLTNRKK